MFIYECEEKIPTNVMVIDAIQRDKASAEKILNLLEANAAIPFYDDVEDSEEVIAAISKVNDSEEKLTKYVQEKSVRNFQSKTVGCRSCGSSLAKEYLKDDICPVCGQDLRSQGIIDGEVQIRQRIDDAKEALFVQREINRIKNGKILWLSNFEDNSDTECGMVAPEEVEEKTE